MHHVDAIQWDDVVKAFQEKCDYKKINYTSAQEFFIKNKMTSCKKEWVNSLNHHLKSVPPFDNVIADIKEQIANKKIFSEY